MQPTCQVRIRRAERPIRRDRVGQDAQLLVAQDVGERDRGATHHVATAGHAEVERGAPFKKQLLEGALSARVRTDQRVGQRRLEVDDRTGAPELLRLRRIQRLLAGDGVQAILTFIVGDKGDALLGPIVVSRPDHDRVQVARRGVRKLTQLAVLQVECPDVKDLSVPRHVGVDWLRRIDGRRREDEGSVIDELTPGFVVRAKCQLDAVLGREVELEELVVPETRAR